MTAGWCARLAVPLRKESRPSVSNGTTKEGGMDRNESIGCALLVLGVVLVALVNFLVKSAF